MGFYSEESYSEWVPFLEKQKENIEVKTYEFLKEMNIKDLDYYEMNDDANKEIGIYYMEAEIGQTKHEIYFTDYLEDCKLEWGTPFQKETFFLILEKEFDFNEEEKVHIAFIIQEFFSAV